MKKYIILLVMSIFLISAVSFISATDNFDDVVDTTTDFDDVDMYVDDSVDDTPVSNDNTNGNVKSNEKVKLTVKINWKDNGASNRPNSVTVYVKNGNNIVSTVVLSKDNGWSKTINVDKYDGSGNQISYSVSADKIGNYKEPVVKNNGTSFIITNELGGSNPSSVSDVIKQDNNNNTSKDTDNGKKTKDKINNVTNNTINNNTKINNNTTVNKIVKKPPKETPKENAKKQDQKKPLLNTGNPLLILVVAIVIVGVAYYLYSKR